MNIMPEFYRYLSASNRKYFGKSAISTYWKIQSVEHKRKGGDKLPQLFKKLYYTFKQV